jgi:hypothetical protein
MREGKDLISSAVHVCIMREYITISEIKRHYTTKKRRRNASLFEFETSEDIRFIYLNTRQVQGLLDFF